MTARARVRKTPSPTALAVALLLGCGISVSALAATSADLNESLNLADDELQVVAPVLSLTPRVATMLDRIFETDSEQADFAPVESSSPLAERVTDRPELEDEVESTRSRIQPATADEEYALPKISQRMYRKDI